MYQHSCSVQLTAVAANESAIVLTSSGMSPELPAPEVTQKLPDPPEGFSRFLHLPENTAIEIVRQKYTSATTVLKSKSCKQIYTVH